ncbi:unnamed protein product [Echinostoma caproni]|uniref:Uncharacterized protein n=1 Tax=Echinostoma caproni TaxID=27848 RepID=A0A183B0L5_9TREM|nr:unnamed protein product [Echinostoma caproni]
MIPVMSPVLSMLDPIQTGGILINSGFMDHPLRSTPLGPPPPLPPPPTTTIGQSVTTTMSTPVPLPPPPPPPPPPIVTQSTPDEHATAFEPYLSMGTRGLVRNWFELVGKYGEFSYGGENTTTLLLLLLMVHLFDFYIIYIEKCTKTNRFQF